MRAAERQLATTSEARELMAAGFERQLRSLIEQVAGNAANPLADAIEDLLAGAA